LVASNSHGALYVSTNAIVGDQVYLQASLNDSDTVALTVTNSTGSVVFQTGICVGGAEFAVPPSTGVSCGADWDTAAPDPQGNPITPGTYTLAATDIQGSPIVLEANFTLGSNSSNTAVATVTLTETSTTQAVTTTYVLPSGCILMPVGETTTTTITVGPTPPASTTTVTVTTTLTSYTQTVTATGCAGSNPPEVTTTTTVTP
jgi:hypothetical protein